MFSMTFKCRTGAGVFFSCEWAIDNFSSCSAKKGECYQSPLFSSKADDEFMWYVRMYPRGIQPLKDNIMMFLQLMNRYGTEVKAKSTYSILNANGEEVKELTEFKANSGRYYAFVRRDILFNKKQSLFPDDKLTIVCNLYVASVSIDASGYCFPFNVPECSLSNDLALLFEDQQQSDVVLTTGVKEFKAHKAVLAARSPIFAAMFQSEMEGSMPNRVDIADIDGEVLEQVLRYIYTGRAPNLGKMADRLWVAADKYAMKRLKGLCEKSLCDNLEVENAADALLMGDIHGAEVLRAYAIMFISQNMAAITETAGWEKILFKHHLVTEVVRATVKPLNEEKEEKNKQRPDNSEPIH